MSTVVGVFHNRDDAERAAHELRQQGLHERISIVARGDEEGRGRGGEQRGGMTMGGREGDERGRMGGEASSGAWTGAAIGGAGGLLASAGLFTIPGIGPILALGPLAAGLTGAAAGGLVGGLVDLGIPRHRGEYYEQRVREGKILCAVEADGSEEEVRRTFERYGAADIETH